MDVAREVTLETTRRNGFESETSTYLLLGMNHLLKHKKLEGNEEEKAQMLALAMTLMHRVRKEGSPSVEFYLQMITLLGHYREYDKLDLVIQNMNKDRIAFDGRMWGIRLFGM